jgi:hypothetical protein
MDGADRIKPRPGMSKQEVCEWRAIPPGGKDLADGEFALGAHLSGSQGSSSGDKTCENRLGYIICIMLLKVKKIVFI